MLRMPEDHCTGFSVLVLMMCSRAGHVCELFLSWKSLHVEKHDSPVWGEGV